MSKGDVFESDWLKLIFNATPIPNIADNAASAPLTNLYVSLHTADPNLTPETGDQTTSEATYTGYARQPVARSALGWTVSGTTPSKVNPVNPITFGQCTSGSSNVSYWAVGTAVSGTGKILYSGSVTPPISVVTNVTPQLTVGSQITED